MTSISLVAFKLAPGSSTSFCVILTILLFYIAIASSCSVSSDIPSGVELLISSTDTTSTTKVEFLKAVTAREYISSLNTTYFNDLGSREIILKSSKAIRMDSIDVMRNEYFHFYINSITDFTELDKFVLREAVASLLPLLADSYPLLLREPWRFIKLKGDAEFGFSHTHGTTIILSASSVDMLIDRHKHTPEAFIELASKVLVHEKIHINQRFDRDSYFRLYSSVLNLISIDNFTPNEWYLQNKLSNPDSDGLWAVKLRYSGDHNIYLLSAIVESTGDNLSPQRQEQMIRDPMFVAIQLHYEDDTYQLLSSKNGTPPYIEYRKFDKLQDVLPFSGVYSFPEEIIATFATNVFVYENIYNKSYIHDLNTNKPNDIRVLVHEYLRELYGGHR